MITEKYIKENNLELFEDSYDIPDDLNSKWELFEATSDTTGIVDGVNILARAVGPAGVLDGKSQNNRFYESKLWKRVISEAQETINRGQMLGTCGHGTPLDDSAILEGKVSHRISKAWLDENKKIVIAEFLILNTPAGRNMNTLLRSGVQMPVSSRGYGKYSGTMEDGTRIVDSDSYKLECWDFVRVPGIPSAIPRIVEDKAKFDGDDDTEEKNDKKISKSSNDKESTSSSVETDKTDKGKKDKKADNEENDKVASEHVKKSKNKPEEVKENTHTPLVEQRKVYTMEDSAVLTRMTEEKIRLEETLRSALETNTRLQETINALNGQVDEYKTTLGSYRQLGAIEDISRVMDVTETMLQNRPVEEGDFIQLREALDIYEELGSPEELEALFDKFEVFMNQYEELGTPADLDRAIEGSAALLEGYTELGSPGDINEAFDSVEAFMGEMSELGTIAEMHGVCDLLEAYQEFGTPNELKRSFEMMNALVDNTTINHITSEGRIMAAEFGIDQAIAENMVQSMGSVKAREALGAINESRGGNVSSRYVAPKKGAKNESGSLNEDGERPYSAVSKTLFNNTATSRGQRLIDKMSR